MRRLFRGRPCGAGGRGGDVSPWRRGSYLLRSLSGFVPGSVSFSRDRVHSVPFFMPCMKNISLARLTRCHTQRSGAENSTVKLRRRALSI